MKSHSNHFIDLVTNAKQKITEISTDALHQMLEQGRSFYLIDVREAEELESGGIPTAIHLSKGVIERDIETVIPDLSAEIVLYCSGGYRSALVALNLNNMGYQHVASLSAGLRDWIASGYPLATIHP